MNARRPDNQWRLAFAEEPAGEARPLAAQEVESSTAACETERPVDPVMEMMEVIYVSMCPNRPHDRPNRRVRTRTHGGVGGVGPQGPPLVRLRVYSNRGV